MKKKEMKKSEKKKGKKSTPKEPKKRSLKLKIKEKLFSRNQKADIISANLKDDTIKLKVEETITDGTGKVIQKRDRTRKYSLSTKRGLSPKREGKTSKRIQKEKKPKGQVEKSGSARRIKERKYRKTIEKRDAARPKYHEIKLEASSWHGTGKAWVQKIEDGQRTTFENTYNVDRPDKYKSLKTYRLKPGEYLINERGTKSHDERYKMRVNPDGSVEKYNMYGKKLV